MTIPRTVAQYLREHEVEYSVIAHSPCRRIQQAARVAGVELGDVVRAVLLRVRGQYWAAVLQADRLIDFGRIEALLGERPEPVPAVRCADWFSDVEAGAVPVLAHAYGLPVLFDSALLDQDVLHLGVGCYDKLITITRTDFARLCVGCRQGDFSQPDPVSEGVVPGAFSRQRVQGECMSDYLPEGQCRDYLDRLYALPPLPQVAMQVLALRNDPNAGVNELTDIVSRDPSLAAQVVRYARSPFFANRGEADTIRDAIHRVLGFEMVANLAIGLAAGRPFRTPVNGPLGLSAFWRHAAYTATLGQELAKAIPADRRPKTGLAYLAALLHNFGFLLLGYLFRPEFEMLNRLAAANPDVPVVSVENQVLAMGHARQVICVGHARLGAWLMEHWRMPSEVVVTLAEHHNPEYAGQHSEYVALVLVADRLARRCQLGDGDNEQLPAQALERLGLTEDAVASVFEQVMECRDRLDSIAKQLVA